MISNNLKKRSETTDPFLDSHEPYLDVGGASRSRRGHPFSVTADGDGGLGAFRHGAVVGRGQRAQALLVVLHHLAQPLLPELVHPRPDPPTVTEVFGLLPLRGKAT